MSPSALAFAAVALLPAMTAPSEGTPQPATASVLLVALCNGGSAVLPLGSDAPLPAATPCCAKGCHGKRRRIDRKQ